MSPEHFYTRRLLVSWVFTTDCSRGRFSCFLFVDFAAAASVFVAWTRISEQSIELQLLGFRIGPSTVEYRDNVRCDTYGKVRALTMLSTFVVHRALLRARALAAVVLENSS